MKRTRESGNIIVFTVIGMTVFLGAAGLAIDMGVLRYEKRLQQTAADAAAIAGASNLTYSGYDTGAKNASALNGFTDGQNSVTVTVNAPPQSGPHKNVAGYVEVYVAAVQPTYFMKVFGVGSETVTTRAVATANGGGTDSGCLYTLGPPTNGIGININGNPTLNAKSCGIVDNGNFDTKGNALVVNAGTFGVAGNADQSGKGGTVTCTDSSTCPVTGMPASGDPLSYLMPPCTACSGGTAWSGGGTISPGTYSGINVGNGTLNMQAGIYTITGSTGFSVGGNGTVTGTGVTIYLGPNAGGISATGTPTINLTAPGANGAYPGILVYQDPLNTTASSLGGNSGSYWTGAIYLPKSDLTFYGDTGGTAYGIVVANSLSFSGNPTVNLNGQAGLPTGVNVIKNAVLVE